MTDQNRQHRRIEKVLTMQFCLSDIHKKWDMSIIQNISAGGVMFIAPSDMKLLDKVVHLQIKIPELAPRLLELEAVVLSVKPRLNSKSADVRAKFINLSEVDKENLSILEKIINLQENKNASKPNWKKI